MIEQFFGKPATVVVAGAQKEDRFHLLEQGLRPLISSYLADHAFQERLVAFTMAAEEPDHARI